MHPVLLTAHGLKPAPKDSRTAGRVGVTSSVAASEIYEWWAETLERRVLCTQTENRITERAKEREKMKKS